MSDGNTPLEWWTTAHDARVKARRAFFRGLLIGGAVIWIADAALSADVANFGGTGCQMYTVSGQAHVAELFCRNVNTIGNSMSDAGVEVGGIYVHLTVFHGPGDVPDHFIAVPPDGYVADPSPLILNEWTNGTIRIFPFVGS